MSSLKVLNACLVLLLVALMVNQNETFSLKRVKIDGRKFYNNAIRVPIMKLFGKEKKKKKLNSSAMAPVKTIGRPAFWSKKESMEDTIIKLHYNLRKEALIRRKKLVWKRGLARQAKAWAERCENNFELFEDSMRDSMGQNIYVAPNGTVDAAQAVALWSDYKASYDSFERLCKPQQNCYPYLQMIWPKTRYVGCGMAECDNIEEVDSPGTVLVCIYNPL